MLPATTPKPAGQVKRSGARHTGIVDMAKQLGVERTHLYRVLKGQRVSRALLERYAALKAKRGDAA